MANRKHPLYRLLPMALGVRPSREAEDKFRVAMRPIREFFDHYMTEREQRFCVEYLLNSRDAEVAARCAKILTPTGPDAPENSPDRRLPERPPYEWQKAARNMLRKAHIQVSLRALTSLCRLDRPDRPTVLAEAICALDTAVTSRERSEALRNLILLRPELKSGTGPSDPTEAMRVAEDLLRRASDAGNVGSMGDLKDG